MQLSNLALFGCLAQIISAAPIFVTVTEVVETTVFINPGETHLVGAAYAPSTTATPTAEATTATAPTTTASPEYVAPATTSSTSVETSPAALTTTTSPVPTTSSSTLTTPTPTSTSATPTSTSTSAAATTTAASNVASDFASDILAEHNAKRALHNVDALTWDNTLASYAQNYADAYDCSGTLTHSGGPYGENLALGYTTTGSVDAWYSEGDGYDYGSGCSVYDHFTQVVWKSTTKVGCGYKSCGGYWGNYIICSYDPAGNYVGECDSNVLPLA